MKYGKHFEYFIPKQKPMGAKDPRSGKIAFYFNKAITTAREVVNDPIKLHKLLNMAVEKVIKLRKENKEFDQLMMKLGTAIRMVRAYKNKSYTEIPWKSILLLTAGLVYFVMPLDLIPDFIPVVGLLDDASIMIWIFGALRSDIENFELWEQESTD